MYKIDGTIAFVAHPRTGSRSTRDLLLELGAERAAGHHQVDEVMLRNVLTKGGFGACTVRNMFDVLVSWYYNANFNNQGGPFQPEPPTFDEYLFTTIEKPTHRWFMTPIYHYGLPWCSFHVRYENLEADVVEMLKRAGLPNKPLEHVGKSVARRPDYQSYYGETTRRAVEKRWASDLHLTGYEF